MEALEVLEQKVNYSGLIRSIDIRPNEYLLPLHEIVVNAIQSIEDVETSNFKGEILINILLSEQTKIDNNELEVYEPILGFEVIDNGIGFTDEREKAFCEPYTNFNIRKGGKGVGRYTALACFSSLEIESIFINNDTRRISRKYIFDNARGLGKYKDKILENESLSNNQTKVFLNTYKPEYFNESKKDLIDKEKIANSIIQHCLLFFISSKQLPIIRVKYKTENITEALVLNDIYKSVIEIEKTSEDIFLGDVKEPFKISYVRNFNNHSHSIHLCANQREVGKKISLTQYLPSFKQLENTEKKKYFLSIYVESEFLDKNNHPQRNRFTFPENVSKKNDFDIISMDELLKNISLNVRENYDKFIIEAEKEKNERIQNYILNPEKPRLRYRHLLRIENIFNDIPINASDDVLEAKLHEKEYNLEQRRAKEFQKVFSKREYDKKEFGSIVSEVLKQESEFSKDKLADLMIKRKSVIKLFQKYLEWRDEGNFMLEKDLHNIIFTMGSESDSMPNEYHNLWLLDERFTFHTYTASDTKLKTNKTLESKEGIEPDLLIYDSPFAFSDNADNINSLVVFEFKKPGMELQNDIRLDELIEKYFKKLLNSKARSSKGKLLNIENTTPKFGYIVCELNKTIIEHNINWYDFRKSAHGNLYKTNPSLNMTIEVMSYEQMLDFAEKRHHSFFKAIGLDNI